MSTFKPNSYLEALKVRQSRPQKPRSPLARKSGELSRVAKAGKNVPSVNQSAGIGITARRGTLRAVGKKGAEWIAVRKALKKLFNWAGITICEARLPGCYFDDMLSFGHCKKRRKMEGHDIWHVALLCLNCHAIYERLSHEDMHTRIHAIIDRRGLLLPAKLKSLA